MTSITIPSSITDIDGRAFAGCKDLADVYCYAEQVPSTRTTAFADSYINYSTLHVPASAINAYKTTDPWSGFGTIVALDGEEPEAKQCATPTISYADGKLSFDSETEGVEFISKITSEDFNSFYTSEIDLTATYTITVYATKAGYDNSETATATLCWMEKTPGEDTSIGVIQVPSRALLIQQQGSVLTVQGAADGTLVSVYGVNGILAGSAVAQSGLAAISHNLPAGSVAIIKVGEQTVKVVVQ